MNEYIRKRLIAKKMIAPIIVENWQTMQSGIYLFERTDENGVTFFYCGQAQNIYNRIISHWNGYQRIDLSIRKRGFKSESNPYGWTFTILEYCTNLDEREQYYILENLKEGKQTYNLTYGRQGQGKETIGEGKTPKGYYDGVKYGYDKARKEIKHLFDLHLNAVIKSDKPNKTQEKALQKFKDFLDGSEE